MRIAFGRALDLAFRRDPLQSLIVPLLLRLPWVLALALLPPPEATAWPAATAALTGAALVGDFVLLLLVTGMLRFRARSVFERPGVPPAPALECYALATRRLPWLFATEVLRNLALLAAAPLLLLPALFLGFRLSCATEAVVLHDRGAAAAFARSWRLTEGRFERWLEMIVASVVLVLAIAFAGALGTLLVPAPGTQAWAAATWLAITAATPVIQYAWSFFYLRLVETDRLSAAGVPLEFPAAARSAGSAGIEPPTGLPEGGLPTRRVLVGGPSHDPESPSPS
jgi:hypothetical protein